MSSSLHRGKTKIPKYTCSGPERVRTSGSHVAEGAVRPWGTFQVLASVRPFHPPWRPLRPRAPRLQSRRPGYVCARQQRERRAFSKSAAVTGWVPGEAAGQTHLSSVDPRLSISLATSAISSFSLCGIDGAGLSGQEDTDQKQSKIKQNEIKQTKKVNLSNFGIFIYSMNVY